MKYFLFLLSSFLLAATTAYAQEQPTSTRISVSGHIVDEQEQPVPFATVSVGHSGKGVVSDEEGFFFIKFPASDTLILSTVAHRTQYLYFGDTATTENYDLKIRLSEEAYELQSVTVFAFKDEYAFKKAILELDDLPEENEKIVIPGSYDGPRREVKPSVMSPVSLVASIFSKRAKYEREAREKIAASKRSNALAQQYKLKLHETPVGFNHIADLMMNEDVLIGGEESGGISVDGHIPEGDGILMGLLLLEVMAVARAPLHEIIADLQQHFGPAHYARIDAHLAKQIPKSEMVKRLADSAPSHLNGEAVARVDTLDGVKFYLADNSWLLIRPSGTEPVLRIYAEAHSPEAVKAMLETGSALGQQATE